VPPCRALQSNWATCRRRWPTHAGTWHSIPSCTPSSARRTVYSELHAELSAPDRLRQMQQYDLSEKPPVQKLLELSAECAMRQDPLDVSLRDVTHAARDILQVAMVAVWLRDAEGSSMRCAAIDAPAGIALQKGQQLSPDAAPAYGALQQRLHQALPVHDVRLHPAAGELTPLLRGADIRSLLEVPLTLYGENVGLVSFGEAGRRRSWTRDDVLYASHIAHVVAQMLSDQHHAEHEQALAETNRSLERRVEERTAALQEALRALNESSLTDPLTGLRNRRFLMQQLDVDAALSARRYESLTRPKSVDNDADLVIFMVDIDHFKHVNDTHGHPAGDAVLMQIKARLQRVFRESDYLVRWGGEEFLIVARSTAREFAGRLAERVRATVADEPFELPDGVRLNKTCSIGFASFPFVVSEPRCIGWQEVVSLVDMALYAAKRAGRDAWVGMIATDKTSAPTLVPALKAGAAGVVSRGEIELSTNLDPVRVASVL
jgi:diguanylate cyclase (GGDEF)-like protein